MKIEEFKRINSCFLPTPIHRLNNFSDLLESNIFMKRDDLTGNFFGGNKERKLEYIMADAISKKSTTIVTVGSVTSNHNRITAGFANRIGLKTELIIIEKENINTLENWNYKLCKKLGAEIHIVKKNEVKEKIKNVIKNVEKKGEKPYFIEGGGHNILGTISYIEMVRELFHQMKYLELIADYIVLPVGTGTTYAGIIMGCKIFNYENVKVIGISIARDKKRCIEEISAIIKDTEENLKTKICDYSSNINIYDNYIGDGYSIPTKKSKNAIKIIAEKEGIILDPIYNGKALSGLIELISDKKINGNIIYINTGGIPNIFSNYKI